MFQSIGANLLDILEFCEHLVEGSIFFVSEMLEFSTHDDPKHRSKLRVSF